MSSSEQAEDDFLPEHTNNMRAAFQYCRGLAREHTTTQKSLPTTVHISKEAGKSALTLPEQRCQALDKFWERQQDSVQPSSESTNEFPMTIDVRSSSLSALEFRQQFQNGNIPCLVRGLDSFSSVCSQWRQEGGEVNRTWFQEKLGNDIVPVRYQASGTTPTVLDDEGRAEECETKEMTLGEWIRLLEQQSSQRPNTLASSSSPSINPGEYYLKDWHLQSHLREEASNGKTSNGSDGSLYQVPPYFQFDLLNSFLAKFSKKGDYMFTYWGPRGSRTSLHSDVLNSFSWSFNVAGTKEWKFFLPPPNSTTPEEEQSSSSEAIVTVIQHSGECIFVSSGWKHEVVNLAETLSINHNWVTTANMDLTWECMCCEMKAIESELEAWGVVEDDCWDARESMLLGCVGLDVTAFFFMLLTRLLDLLLQPPHNIVTSDNNADEVWQYHFDLMLLKEGLLVLGQDQDLIRLQDRLGAVLKSEESALEAVALVEWATEYISYETI